MISKKIVSAAFLLLLSFCCPALEFSDADIVLPRGASKYLQFSANELALHLRKITGGKFRITAESGNRNKILLGVFPAGFDKKRIASRDAIAVIARENTLYIAGYDTYDPRGRNDVYTMLNHQRASKGTLAAVYCFLEDQGVRWLAPGLKNTFIPRRKSIRVPDGEKIFSPVIKGRAIADIYNFGEAFLKKDGREYLAKGEGFGGHLWGLRNRYNRQRYSYAHSQAQLKLDKLWTKNPERFQLMKNGKRNKKYLCWTDPAVTEIWKKAADGYFSGKTPAEAGLPQIKHWRGLGLQETFCIDPMDHGSSNDGRCYCKRCQDFRKKNPCADDSEIMWRVIAEVAQMVKAKYPGKYVGTLVYPPKQRMPRTVKVPENIRVVICLPGPKKINDPKSMKYQLDTLRSWSSLIGRDNVGIWTYQCELHGGKLPGVPECYPEYFQRYLKQILPYTRSIYHEYHAHNLTYRILENYLQYKLLWNPGADVKKLRAEHIRLYYGPAAGPMSRVFDAFEKNWQRIEQGSGNLPDPSNQIGIYRDFKPLKKFVWGKIYDKKEMARLAALLDRAEKLAGKGIYGERIERFRRLVFDCMAKERAEVMDLADLAPDIVITSAPWSRQKSYKLVSAHRNGVKTTASVSCRFRVDKKFLHAQVIADEPYADAVKITRRLKNGSDALWQDWALELFIYTPADKNIRQYLVNAANVISCATMNAARKRVWSDAASVKSSVKREKNQFTWSISIPLSELGSDLKGLKLNVTHERNIKKRSQEYLTLSPAALLGNWIETECYARVKFQ